MARPLPVIDEPICVWQPSQQLPDFGAVAWSAKSRWKFGARRTSVVVASDLATRIRTGRNAREIKQCFQLTHDLGVSETFLRFRQTRPAEATLWNGEDIIARFRRKKKLPDAIIAGDDIWPPRLAVEFAGAYSRGRIKGFHKFCEQEQLPYELW